MRTFEFPITKAKTAWGLLQDVKKRVLQVPEAIDMREVLERAHNPCGTVGCLAGECCLLTVGRDRALRFALPLSESRMGFAHLLLGGEGNIPRGISTKREQLQFESALSRLFDGGGSDGIAKLEPGTERYARAVVARVDRFMARFETRLKRTKLAPVVNG